MKSAGRACCDHCEYLERNEVVEAADLVELCLHEMPDAVRLPNRTVIAILPYRGDEERLVVVDGAVAPPDEYWPLRTSEVRTVRLSGTPAHRN